MASSSSSASKGTCVTCDTKTPGIFRCEGCLNVFCKKHLLEHRDFLSHQLDEIALEHDTLQQIITENNDKQNYQQPMLKKINKWEKESIRKIQAVAEQAREQVKQIISNSSPSISKELDHLAKQLERARTNDDYVETDLQTWTDILQKLKNEIDTYSPSISIREDETEILVGKIHVTTNATKSPSQQMERFGESFGKIRIENDGCLAIHGGSTNKEVYVRGTGEYSSGKHTIRFLVKKNNIKFVSSFGIVSKSMPLNGDMPGYQVYGWASNDDVYSDIKIPNDKDFRDMQDQTSFEIELQIDCDHRKISYINQETKNRREMKINISKCPFPWQTEFYLYAVGDSVTLLS